uniref:Uncharacterized protein n=1 Tax=Phytophthora infestans TaxID=4787 RepID=Q572G2_PHYIN|nr:hypothetical protein, conserved [Phytophthora infestans]
MKEQVKQLQVEGNALYADGRYDAARAIYTKGISLLTSADERTSSCASGGINADSWEAVTASQLLSNRAQTAIQERDFAAALHASILTRTNILTLLDATLALKYNTKNEKALLRKLVALENLERFEAALQLVDNVLDNGEKSAPAAFQYCVAARRRLRKNLARDREVAASEVQQMGKMVHDKQQLRINFGCVRRNYIEHLFYLFFKSCCLLPSQVPLDQFFNVNVNIGNEFGLFRRDYVKNGEKIYLQCSLRHNTENKYKLTFQEPLDPSDTGDLGSADAIGKLTLNGRGKASFRVAVVTVDASSLSSTSKPLALEIRSHESSTETWNLFPVVSLPFTVHPRGGALKEGNPGHLDYNIHLNYPQEAADSAAKGAVLPVAQAHLWGDPPRDLPLQPDVIVLSDVVYDPEGYAPLVTSLEALATSSETRILMAHRSRNPMEHQFFELLSQSFSCQHIDWLSTEKTAPKATAFGGPPSTEAALQDVKIFEIRRLATQ